MISHVNLVKILTILALVIVGILLWITLSSCIFLWLSGLWDSPLIPHWRRPWQWIAYARLGGRNWSEILYLVASAFAAAMPIVFYARTFIFDNHLPMPVYGRTQFATFDQMKTSGITSQKEPF